MLNTTQVHNSEDKSSKINNSNSKLKEEKFKGINKYESSAKFYYESPVGEVASRSSPGSLT